MDTTSVRVRFAPSPTGYLHVGGARTALFNWLIARGSSGGKFILRIEDTDQSRHVGDSVRKIQDDLRWLGLDWDEGPEAGGDCGPYFQSERLDIYKQWIDKLLADGNAYYAFETPQELAAMRDQAKREKRTFRYVRPDALPTEADAQRARDAGRPVVVRFKMPSDKPIEFFDSVLGPIVVAESEAADFIICKADGWPTYHLAVVVDDHLMRITHVLRGQEHLGNTAKHIALQRALGFATQDHRGSAPIREQDLKPNDLRYAHLPIIFNMDGSKMSKRDKEKAQKQGIAPPEIDVHDFRATGYLPEALLNFISLLGWSTGDDVEQITLEETAKRFKLTEIGKGNAKFDRSKLIAFNTDWSARVADGRRLEAFKDYLDINDSPMARLEDAVLPRVLACCEGFRTFADVVAKAGFIFTADSEIVYQEKAVRKVLLKNDGAGFAMLETLLPRLESLGAWTESDIEALLTETCDQGQVKLGAVAQPLRVAVSGTTVSPAIYDTLDMLGRDKTLNRIRNVLLQRNND